MDRKEPASGDGNTDGVRFAAHDRPTETGSESTAGFAEPSFDSDKAAFPSNKPSTDLIELREERYAGEGL